MEENEEFDFEADFKPTVFKERNYEEDYRYLINLVSLLFHYELQPDGRRKCKELRKKIEKEINKTGNSII
jgi:hypothetical protein